jgi:hypothetical protein
MGAAACIWIDSCRADIQVPFSAHWHLVPLPLTSEGVQTFTETAVHKLDVLGHLFVG